MAHGIDFGTTRCKISTVNASGKPEIVLNQRGEPFTPTAICI